MSGKAWRMHPLAERELDRAAARYDGERAGLGAEFLEDFSAAYAVVRRGPVTGTGEHVGRFVIHRALLGRFPYAIVFTELGERVVVVAIAHVRRRPTYWRRRLGMAGSTP
jgi:hypothetical protein